MDLTESEICRICKWQKRKYSNGKTGIEKEKNAAKGVEKVETAQEKKEPKIALHEFRIGIALLCLSLLLPAFFTVESVGVTHAMERALRESDSVELLKAALLLVMLNSLRGVFHYIGAFFITDSFRMHVKGFYGVVFNAVCTLLLLQVVYQGVSWFYHIRYDFSIPAVLVTTFLIFTHHMDYRYVSLFKKGLLVAIVLTAFQFLDIIPAMLGIPVGLGETSWNIKQTAFILEADNLLNVEGLIGFVLFCLFGILLLFQLRIENHLRRVNLLQEERQTAILQKRILEEKNRIFRESQYLVHDLKSPLTTMQIMTDILRTLREGEALSEEGIASQEKVYFDRMESALAQMNEMISGLLREEERVNITTQELVHIVLAQISFQDYAAYLEVSNPIPHQVVCVNRILFPRALVNLIQNSAQAMNGVKNPQIRLSVWEQDNHIYFRISDNGCGIQVDRQDLIWQRGISLQDSRGRGLYFVKNVGEKLCVEIHMESEEGKGTSTTIILLKGEGKNGERDFNFDY